MTELRAEYDAFLVPGVDARILDEWCDQIEAALRSGQPPEFIEWMQRIPVGLRTLALTHLLEIDRTVAINRKCECRSLPDYQRALPDFAETLSQIWPAVVATTSVNPQFESEQELRWPERLRVIRKLGEGGMGQVHLAEHRLLGRLVAAKVLRQRLSQVDTAVERFRQEIRTLASLQHPGIAGAVDADIIDGHLVLLMEFVPGRTLQDLVRSEGPLPWKIAVHYCSELATILAYTHARSIVHRDVKPGNVMLDNEGRIRLLDLGLARFINDAEESGRETKPPMFSGTPDFAAPEQQAKGPPDPRSDIYGLGSTLYFLVRGNVMYPSTKTEEKLRLHREGKIPTLKGQNNAPPDELDHLFHQLVAKDPAKRIQTMSDVEQSFQQLITGNQSTKVPLGSSRRRWLVASGITAISAFSVPAISWYWQKPVARTTAKTSFGLELLSLGIAKRSFGNGAEKHFDQPELLWSVDLVTKSQFCQVMNQSVGELPESPITGVDWKEANEFCRRLSALPEEKRLGRQYRLPREAEWEAVCETLKVDTERVQASSDHATVEQASRRRWAKTLSERGIWGWCADSLLTQVGPRSINNIPVEARTGQYPLRGGTGLFIHNFDLYMDANEHRIQMESIRVTEESDGRTRYYAPTKVRADGFVVYRYELPEVIQSSRIFGSVLAHKPTSSAKLEVSADGTRWHSIDHGYVVDGSTAPRDITSFLRGSNQAFVRLSLRQDAAPLYWAQALRTSPEPQLQFPHVYQFEAETEPATANPANRLVVPASLRHPRIGLRVVCEIA
jgi:serine/threonine protein kinase